MDSLDKFSLKEQVYSMLKNRLAVEDIRRFRVLKDVKIKGKYSEHEIDIFFQFVQMNNIEKSIVKVIENKIVTSKDVWEFYTVVNDLRYFAKGIIYYKGTVSHEVKLDAERAGIELIYFDLKKEIAEYVAIKLKKMLPDENVIGDPFWTIMETKEGHNTGNYYSYENGIIFAFSKKQAQRLCDSLKISFNYKVYGVSQKQLKLLLDLLALYSKHIHVLIPIDKEARQLIELDNKDLLDCYVREENG